jgi:hypothetical protein
MTTKLRICSADKNDFLHIHLSGEVWVNERYCEEMLRQSRLLLFCFTLAP